MVNGRVRLKGSGKAKRWQKGQSSSSNPESKAHRQAARGRLCSHLSQGGAPTSSSSAPLTSDALASHDAALLHERESDEDITEDSETVVRSEEGGASVATSSAQTLIETANPVFGRVKRLWNSSLGTHREVCAVLAAVSEVVKAHDGTDSETEYFGALMTALESSEDEKSTVAICYLLSVLMPKVAVEVLQAKFSAACKILTEKLSVHQQSTALVRSVLSCLCSLLVAQNSSVWSDSYPRRIFQTILDYTLHPRPKLRKIAQASVAAILKEGTASGACHPVSSLTAKRCTSILESQSEIDTLHVLGMLKDCLANFKTQHLKSLCEAVLKTIVLGKTVVRSTALKAFHGLFTSVAGPQGLTAALNARLIAALHEYQPSVVDVQMQQAWLTVMQSAHTRLASLDVWLCLAHLPRLFSGCVTSLLSEKSDVIKTASTVMETLLKQCVAKCLEEEESRSDGGVGRCEAAVSKLFATVEAALQYKYHSAWGRVLKVLAVFYTVAGSHRFGVMLKGLETLCALRNTEGFPRSLELDQAFGAAVRSMGPRAVLNVVPLELDVESESHDFPRSWMLPVMKESIEKTELGYFTSHLLPLAADLMLKSELYAKSGKMLQAKLYSTLHFQIWLLLPGFCSSPVDVCLSFKPVSRLLGSALSEGAELRAVICHALRVLIETTRNSEADTAEVAKFAKNFLPILFNLYTSPSSDQTTPHATPLSEDPSTNQGHVLECISAYVSIAPSKLIETFHSKAVEKLHQTDLPVVSKCLVFDLLLCFVPHLVSLALLDELLLLITPLLDSGSGSLQKKAYLCLEKMLLCSSHAHQAFRKKHLEQLRLVLLDSLSTASAASKKPRLKCLLHIVDHLTPESAEFISMVTPEVILCLKEVNERARALALKLLVNLGFAAQRCFRKSAEDSVMDYFKLALAGLAGSTHMVSATITALARLVYEFHDLLGVELVARLFVSILVFLSAKTREVVKAALDFIKVAMGVLPPIGLAPHLPDLVAAVLRWSEDPKSHFRLRARVVLERLVRKYSYELVAGLVPFKHRKLILHIRKMNERQKRKKLAKASSTSEDTRREKARSKPSYEDLLDSSDEEELPPDRAARFKTAAMAAAKKRKKKQQQQPAAKEGGSGGAWIKEGEGEEPVDFLDPAVVKRVVATDPARMSARKTGSHAKAFKLNPEGKLMISEETGEGGEGGEAMDTSDTEVNRKRSRKDLNEDGDLTSGGKGIRRKRPEKRDFEYGTDYKAKRARGDVKRAGRPDPYAYVPLLRQKLNHRKQAKLSGQFAGIMRHAQKGSAAGGRAKQKQKRTRKQ